MLFFWAVVDEIHGGKCLVAWKHVCRPKYLGGLGVIDLRKHGLALRLRWLWLQRTDGSRPWQGLPLATDLQVHELFNSLVRLTNWIRRSYSVLEGTCCRCNVGDVMMMHK